MSTLNLATPHQVTIDLTGLGAVNPSYSHTGTWPNADGWALTTPANGVVSPMSDGLRVTANAATVWLAHAAATAAGRQRRSRFLVRLADPEARPVKVTVTDNTGSTTATARMVSGVAVWVEGTVEATTSNTSWLRIERPLGAASATIVVEQVLIDLEDVSASQWSVTRTDSNGARVIAAGPTSWTADRVGLRPNASGALSLVDREASLVGNVSYLVYKPTASNETLNTGADGVLSTGWGVLHRIGTTVLHQVFVMEFRGSYQGQAEPLAVLGSSLPNVPTAPLQARQGTLALLFDTLDAAALVAADLRTGEVHHLRQDGATATSMDAYLVVQSLEVERTLTELETPKWLLTASYQETARGAS